MKKTISIFLLLLISSNLMADLGTEGGGGGDAATLPDGEVVLADVFLDRNQPQPNNMPRRISLNPRLLLQAKIYGDFYKKQVSVLNVSFGENNNEMVELFTELGKRNNSLVFYSVKDEQELNTFCASGGRKVYKLPEGVQVTQVACTSGNEIFLVESIFRKMNLRNQVLLLMHERMTTLKDSYGGKNYGAIAGITSGLGEILKHAYDQQNGKLASLSENEKQRIHHFYEGLIELHYRNSEIPMNALDWKIHTNGGGLIKADVQVDESSFYGVNSNLDGKISIGKNNKIINSHILLRDSTLDIGVGFDMRNSTIHLYKKDVRLDDGEKLINGYIPSEYDVLVPRGKKVIYPEINIPTTLTACQGKTRKIIKNSENFPDCFVSNLLTNHLMSYDTLADGVSLDGTEVDEQIQGTTMGILRSFSMNLKFMPEKIDQTDKEGAYFTIYKGKIYGSDERLDRHLRYNGEHLSRKVNYLGSLATAYKVIEKLRELKIPFSVANDRILIMLPFED